MTKLISKQVFLSIFEQENYRYKLDKIILNFFGLEAENIREKNIISNKAVLLKFILMINTEKVLEILIEDTKKLFQMSKIFYINISFREVEKYHELLLPCYWEIYVPYSYQHLKEKPKLILFVALFYCEQKKEIQEILKKLKIFHKSEIQNILKKIP